MNKTLQQATNGGRDSPMSEEELETYQQQVLNRIAGVNLTPEKTQRLTHEAIHFAERMSSTLMASTVEGYDANWFSWGPVDARFVTGALLKLAGAGQMLADVPGHGHTFAVGDGVLSSYVAAKGVDLGKGLRQTQKPSKTKETNPKAVTQAEVGGYPREIRMTKPAPEYHSTVPEPLTGNDK